MVTFSICIVLLILGYFVYGKFVERFFGADPSREVPSAKFADGVDYVSIPTWKAFMIQFLNIAGLGPVFGAVMGAKFGTKYESAPIFPMMFTSIACGAVSGFHATQSPMMARCIRSEKDGRRVFYGSRVTLLFAFLRWKYHYKMHFPRQTRFFK